MQEGFGFRLPEERNLYSVKDIDKNDKFILGLSKYPYIWSRKTKDTSNGTFQYHSCICRVSHMFPYFPDISREI